MHNEIVATLNQIEKDYGCSVLYACEAGSRAWGLSSSNSDYDVRFIYSYPVGLYLSLDRRAEAIDEMLPGDLDIVGWDIVKTMKLFASCNVSLNEWFDSPVVYWDSIPYLKRRMVDLMPLYFNPTKAAFHYLSIAEKAVKDHLLSNVVNTKKLFYMVRPLLACEWIYRYKSMPPTRFDDLILSIRSTPLAEYQEEILEKRSLKETEKESGTVSITQGLRDCIIGLVSTGREVARTLPTGFDIGHDMLDDIIFDIVLGSE